MHTLSRVFKNLALSLLTYEPSKKWRASQGLSAERTKNFSPREETSSSGTVDVVLGYNPLRTLEHMHLWQRTSMP